MMKLMLALEKLPRGANIVLATVFMFAITLIYFLTGSQIAISIFFLAPISIVTWGSGLKAGVVFSFLSIVGWALADYFNGLHDERLAWFLVNEILRLLLFVAGASVLAALKRLVEEHKMAARVDELTGIANRRAFYEAARSEIARANRNPGPFTVVFTDIDNFKKVNDKFGHSVGDRLLSMTASIMRQNVREIDQVARLGGDEFVILLTGTDSNGASTVMERLRNDLTDMARQNNWPISFSAGAVTFTRPPESVDEMITKADSLMYTVKQSGKDHIRQESS